MMDRVGSPPVPGHRRRPPGARTARPSSSLVPSMMMPTWPPSAERERGGARRGQAPWPPWSSPGAARATRVAVVRSGRACCRLSGAAAASSSSPAYRLRCASFVRWSETAALRIGPNGEKGARHAFHLAVIPNEMIECDCGPLYCLIFCHICMHDRGGGSDLPGMAETCKCGDDTRSGNRRPDGVANRGQCCDSAYQVGK